MSRSGPGRRPQDAVRSKVHKVYEGIQELSASAEALRQALSEGSDAEALRLRCGALGVDLRRVTRALSELSETLEAACPAEGGQDG